MPNKFAQKIMKKITIQLSTIAMMMSIAFTFTACKKDEEKDKVKTSGVYVAGAERNENDIWIATLWKNGVPQKLSTDATKNSFANSVFVSNTDVYVIVSDNSDYVSNGRLWKNGQEQNLAGLHGGNASANAVFVSGKDMYVAGRNSEGQATLWKNGVAKILDTEQNTSAQSVFVLGNDVYVVQGRFLWKNDTKSERLSVCNYGDFFGHSIFVSGNDVYVLGTGWSCYGGTWPNNNVVGKLWKNGVVQEFDVNITEGFSHSSIRGLSLFISGNDAYIAGHQFRDGKTYATLWKNMVVQDLTDGTNIAYAWSVFVFGNDVYVAGFERNRNGGPNVAKLWKNGVAQNLTDETNNAAALSVFVK